MTDQKLVYDVGMHCGEDTEYYLSRRCRVVGIEANPELVVQLRQKLSAEIQSGQLQIVAKAIAATSGKVRFAINRTFSEWGSISTDHIERYAALGTKTDFIEVETVPFAEILKEHGVPNYMKIDIEGMDMECVKALAMSSHLPNICRLRPQQPLRHRNVTDLSRNSQIFGCSDIARLSISTRALYRVSTAQFSTTKAPQQLTDIAKTAAVPLAKRLQGNG